MNGQLVLGSHLVSDERADIIPEHFEKPALMPCQFKASANLVGTAYAWQLRQEV